VIPSEIPKPAVTETLHSAISNSIKCNVTVLQIQPSVQAALCFLFLLFIL